MPADAKIPKAREEPKPAGESKTGQDLGGEVREIIAIFLLSVTAILTAWCGFESSKWGGQMSISFSQASSARIQSVDYAGASRDAQAVDLTIYAQWVNASAQGNESLATYVSDRFTPAFAIAFDDWQHAGESLKSPFAEPSYLPAGKLESQKLAAKADDQFDAALESNQRGDNYSILTVLFALVLFFAAMSGRNKSPWAGWFLLVLGVVVAVCGAIILATFPVLI